MRVAHAILFFFVKVTSSIIEKQKEDCNMFKRKNKSKDHVKSDYVEFLNKELIDTYNIVKNQQTQIVLLTKSLDELRESCLKNNESQ